jgi:hypothetical protein
MVFVHPSIKTYMHEDICQQWTDHSPLRSTCQSINMVAILLHNSCFEPTLHIELNPFIPTVEPYRFHQQLMVNCIEESLNVQVNSEVMVECVLACLCYRLMTISEWSIPKRTVVKKWLYYAFQMRFYYLLRYTV